MGNMPHAFSMIPMLILDPAFVKRKVLLAYDAGNDHGRVLVDELCFLFKRERLL